MQNLRLIFNTKFICKKNPSSGDEQIVHNSIIKSYVKMQRKIYINNCI
jgi:hypothetical protein